MIKFKVDAFSLGHCLRVLIGAVESNQVMQVLSHIHFGLDDILTLTASNTEMEISVKMPIIILEKDDRKIFTISAKKLSDIVRTINNSADILFVIDNEWVQIIVDNTKYKLASLFEVEFPFLPHPTELNLISVHAYNLKKLIDRTVFAVSKQDIRSFFNGLFFEFSSGSLSVVGSDGYRVAYRCMSVDDVHMEPIRAIIPRRSAVELSKLLSIVPEGDAVNLGFAQNMMIVSYGEWKMYSHLIDASYPPYRRILGHDVVCELSLSVDLLKQAMSRMSVCVGDRFCGVLLKFADGKLIIQSSNFEHEEAKEEIVFDGCFGNYELSLAFNYLIDVLNACDSENVIIKIAPENEKRASFTPDNDLFAIYMIMSFTV